MRRSIGPFFVLLIFSSANCDQCITYNFEKDFDTLFSSELSACASVMNSWTLNDYKSLELESPHPRSTMFLSPKASQSCVSSFTFPMVNGTLEINVYMENVQASDFINTLVMDSSGMLDNKLYNTGAINFKPGWNNLKITTGVTNGYVSSENKQNVNNQ